MRADRRAVSPPSAVKRWQRLTGLCLLFTVLAGAAFVVGRAAQLAAADPIRWRDGVPIGVERSPAGAVVAADDYLAGEQATVERDPAGFSALVSQDWSISLRPTALAAAAADRERDPRGMALWANGGHSFTVVGAHRLDWYSGEAAQVTVWAGQIFWAPRQPPCQVWSLGQVTIDWREGRWQVTAIDTLPVSAPVPESLPQAGAGEDSAAAFSRQLAGFAPVTYGSPG